MRAAAHGGGPRATRLARRGRLTRRVAGSASANGRLQAGGRPQAVRPGFREARDLLDHHRGQEGRRGRLPALRAGAARRSATTSRSDTLRSSATSRSCGNQLPEPLKAYPEVLALERAFHERFYFMRDGNHDLVWASTRLRRRVPEGRGRRRGRGARGAEARRSRRHREGRPDFSSRTATRGRPTAISLPRSRCCRQGCSGPRSSGSVNSSQPPRRWTTSCARHDEAMFHWAQCTAGGAARADHGPHAQAGIPLLRVERFPSDRRAGPHREAQARERLAAAEREGHLAVERAELHAMVEYVATKPYGAPPVKIEPPCYFNTGCCSFGDGNITASR